MHILTTKKLEIIQAFLIVYYNLHTAAMRLYRQGKLRNTLRLKNLAVTGRTDAEATFCSAAPYLKKARVHAVFRAATGRADAKTII